MLKLLTIFAVFLSAYAFADPKPLFVMTIPKSGTYLTAKAINMLTDIPLGGSVMNHYLFTDDFLEKNPGIATTAHLVTNFEPLRKNENVKRILVLRDLRDVCISATYWLQKNDWYSLSIDHSQFYLMNFDEQLCYMMDIHHSEYSLKSFAQRAIKWMNTPGVLTIRFEDLIGDHGGGSRALQIETLKKIANYLEFPVSQEHLETVADHLWGGGGTFRKGQINGWKTVFQSKHKTLFKKTLGNLLIELGYEKDLNWD